MLAELINRVGEPWREGHEFDFGLGMADVDKVCDFYNNGGLEFHNEHGENTAIQYASVKDGFVHIGAWVWFDGEDFDQDATFEEYEEDDFSGGELDRIYKRIKEIYGN